MRVKILGFKNNSDLISHLKENKDQIIAQKRSMMIESEPCDLGCKEVVNSSFKSKAEISEKAKLKMEDMENNELFVKVIANVHGWCDSHMDVLLRGSAKKTISDKGASNQKLVYHLKDHKHSSEGVVGRDVEVYTEEIDLSQFNISLDIKKAEALIGESIVPKKYDPKIFDLYSDKEMKQHSIGMQYVKIFLCINSEEPEDTQYKDAWDKYYPQVINKNKVDKKGYFWAVTEYKLYEYSAVLWGASELTPTQSTQPKKDESYDENQEEEEDQKSLISKRKKISLI